MLSLLSRLRLSRYYIPALFILDLCILNSTYFIAIWIDYGTFTGSNNTKSMVFVSNAIWVLLAVYHKAYRIERVEPIIKSINRLVSLIAIHSLIIVFILIAFDSNFSSYLAYYFTFFPITLIICRYSVLKMLRYVRGKGYNFRKVIIFGANTHSAQLANLFKADLSLGYRLIGYFDEAKSKLKLNTPFLGGVEELSYLLSHKEINELFICTKDLSKSLIEQLTHLCEKYMVRARFIPNFQDIVKSKSINIEYYNSLPVIKLRAEPLEHPFRQLLKRIFDILFSLVVIVFVFPWLLPVIIIVIKLNSNGPIFFKQLRSGEGNNSFKCLKFRTMYVNNKADKAQASKNDTRITRVGRFLRSTNLDEFPQFFNVLQGTMSVVGPRPHMLKHTDQYSTLLPDYLVRHYSKPGITGWAQVNGYRGETKELNDMKKRVEFDIYYIENRNFLLDLKIIFLTVYNMIKGEENAF